MSKFIVVFWVRKGHLTPKTNNKVKRILKFTQILMAGKLKVTITKDFSIDIIEKIYSSVIFFFNNRR